MENEQEQPKEQRIPAPSATTPIPELAGASVCVEDLDKDRFAGEMLPRHFAPGAKRKILLSVPLGMFGAIFFAFGGLISSMFVSNADLGSIFRSDEWGEVGVATIEAVEETGAEEMERKILEYHYDFKGRNGITGNGISYSNSSNAQVGDELEVRYDPDDPSDSQLVGMKKGKFSALVLLALIFPAVGLILIFFGQRVRRRLAHALQYWPRFEARYSRSEKAKVGVGDQTDNLFYVYINESGQEQECNTGLGDIPLDQSKPLTLLAPPQGQKGKGFVLETIDSKSSIDERGTITCEDSLRQRLWLIPFCFGVVGMLWVLL